MYFVRNYIAKQDRYSHTREQFVQGQNYLNSFETVPETRTPFITCIPQCSLNDNDFPIVNDLSNRISYNFGNLSLTEAEMSTF